jgi:hypothetical protein
VPSATPLPSGPSHLALFGAEDLMRPDGCPVCRYVAEANDRFLGWFALESHADADMITRMCRSLGFCPRHTRGMLGQPGAAGRMTALYTYLLRAAAQFLAGGTSPSGACLPCARDAEASDRALETLLAGLGEADVRDRYRDSHGLCLPHLRAAAPRAGRKLAAWLAHDMLSRLSAGSPPPAVLAGERDPDADVRARLRASLPAAARATPAENVCAPCHTACLREREAVERCAAADWAVSEPSPSLCPAHLRDACTDPVGRRLLGLESERAEAWLVSLTSAASLGSAFRRRTARHGWMRGGGGQAECLACPVVDIMGQDVRARHAASGPGHQPVLCLRHVLALRRRDPGGATPFVRTAALSTESVLADLGHAFRMRAWAHRDEPLGRQMAPWQRAVALVDGRVYGGGPPRPLSQFGDPQAWQTYRLSGQQPEA